jgi:serine/threonine protein kinase
MAFEFYQERYSGEKAKRYVTSEKLGEGTFGEVKKATDRMTGNCVAIKFVRIMSRNGGIPKAVFRELESLRQLCDCEFIVTLIDVYADEMKLCLVMEYVESDLSEVIERSPRYIQQSHVKAYAHMMFQAVSYCHNNKIIHRDIKPASEQQPKPN